jgi:hypothetical protein
MNRKLTIALVLTTFGALPAALAQTPAPKGDATASPPVLAQTPARAAAGANREVATNADARLCLEFPTNLEVIKCAEKYLQRKRNG